jgi:hypothetical protein
MEFIFDPLPPSLPHSLTPLLTTPPVQSLLFSHISEPRRAAVMSIRGVRQLKEFVVRYSDYDGSSRHLRWVSEWVSECVCEWVSVCVCEWVSKWVCEHVKECVNLSFCECLVFDFVFDFVFDSWVYEWVYEWVSVYVCMSECVSKWVSVWVCFEVVSTHRVHISLFLSLYAGTGSARTSFLWPRPTPSSQSERRSSAASTPTSEECMLTETRKLLV